MTSAPLHLMATSILLRTPSHTSPSPSPSPASTPLPALQTDLSSSSSSASGSCLDLRPPSAPSSRRIRFAPLPDPRRDDLSPSDDPHSDSKPVPQTLPVPNDLPDGFVALSPSVSPVSTLSSTRSTPTIRVSPNTPSKTTQRSSMKFLRPFSFLRHSRSSLPSQSVLPQSDSLPDSLNITRSSTSLPNSPSFQSAKLSRFSTEDVLTFGTKSLFRSRSESASGTRSVRPSSPCPKSSDLSTSLHRPVSTDSAPSTDSGKSDCGVGSGTKRRRASSASTPGAGGGRHACSTNLPPHDSSRPSTAPNSPAVAPKKHVKLLNGRVYGAKRFAAQTLANPFANVRDEPEFVEWGYGGMGSVHASAGIANDVWKGLQRSERGGALLAGSSFGPPTHPTAGAVIVGGGRGSGASPIARRKMSADTPECNMGSVGTGGDEDDGSGMGWVRRRRAEREARARLEQEAKEVDKKAQEGRKSGDSMDASMYASTASTTTSLTACTSAASTDITTPATSPLTSRSPSLVNLNLTSSPSEPDEQSQESHASVRPTSTPIEEHDHHVLTAVRLSPNISISSHKHGHSATHGRSPSLPSTLSSVGKVPDSGIPEQTVPPSPVDTETTSANSLGDDDEDPSRRSDEGVDDEEDEAQDTRRKTALGAGVEKISRHVDVEAR